MANPFILKPAPGDVGIVRGARGRFQSAQGMQGPTPQDVHEFAEAQDVSNTEALQALRVPDRDVDSQSEQPVETTGTASKTPPVTYPETNPFPPVREEIPYRLR